MPTNRRNSSTFVACVVFLLSLWPALPATAQGVLKVDTLFRSYAPDVVRYEVIGVHGDTVLIRGRNIETATNGLSTYIVHVSTDGGTTFDTATTVDRIGLGGIIPTPRRRLDRTSPAGRSTRVARDGINFTEQLVAEYLDVFRAEGYFLHPTRPDTSFLLVRSGSDRYGNYREWMFYRFNDNDQWTNLYVPFPKIGLHRAITLEFDYGRPNRLYATVDSETSYGGLADHLGPKWLYYVTDDWGQTWTELEQHPLGADACNGNTSCHVRIGLPIKDHGIVHIPMGANNISVPIVKNLVTGQVDSTMGSSLLLLVDSLLLKNVDTARNVRFEFFKFLSLECPDVWLVTFRYEIKSGANVSHRGVNLLTTNGGQDWTRPFYVPGLQATTDSLLTSIWFSHYLCERQDLIVNYERYRRTGPDNFRETFEAGILRASLKTPTSTAYIQMRASHIAVEIYPNPATELATVSIDGTGNYTSDLGKVRVVDALGRYCADRVLLTPHSDNTFTIDVRRLAAGMYRVILNVGGTLQSIPLVIQR